MEGTTPQEEICASIDCEGRITHAHPQLLKLQLQAGGEAKGKFVIPQIAELIRRTRQFSMPQSAPIMTGDEDNDISFYAETKITKDKITLRSYDWVVRAAQHSQSHLRGRVRQGLSRGNKGPIPDDRHIIKARFDHKYRLVQTSHRSLICFIGRKLMDFLQFAEPNEQSRIEDKLYEKQPLPPFSANISGLPHPFIIDGQPLIDNSGNYVGYNLSMTHNAKEGREEYVPNGNINIAHNINAAGASNGSYALQGTATPREIDGEGEDFVRDRMIGTVLVPALRQPLGRIVAKAESIGGRLQGPLRNEYTEYASDIAAAGRHLLSLIDDLSDLEVIGGANFKVAKDKVDLNDLANRAIGLLAVKAADRSVTIKARLSDGKIPAIGEFRRVLQVLVNLIGNAINYSPSGSIVTVETGQESDQSLISIADNGPGIATGDQSRIFDKYERLGRSGDDGGGLGLYISRA